MTRTKLIACKSTGGKLPCTHLATRMTPPPFIPENPLVCRSYLRNFHEIGGQVGKNREIIWQGLHRPYFMLIKACYNNLLLHLPSCVNQEGTGRFWSKSGCITEYFHNLLNYMKCIKVPDDDMKANTKEISHQSETEGRCLHCKSNTDYLANIGWPSLCRV